MTLVISPIPTVDLTLRAPATADAEAIAALLNACSRAQTGADEFTPEALLREWQTPGFDPQASIRLAEGPDGQLIGFVERWSLEHLPTTHWVWGRTHPAWEGQGIGTRLLEWAEAGARAAIPSLPQELRVTMRAEALSTHTPTAELLRGHGFSLIRHFWRMVIELDAEPPAPQWPQGITLRPFERERDGLAVYRVIDECFQDHWGHVDEPEAEGFARWAHYAFDPDRYDPTLWYVAMDGEQIAGIARCAPKSWDDDNMAWIHQLAVRRPWRKQGLGLALLHHAFGEFRRRGKPRVGLGVDASNLTGATRLYERAGMRVARQFDTYEKELRPGREVSHQG